MLAMNRYLTYIVSFSIAVSAPLIVFAQESSGIVKCGPQQGRLCELKDLFELLVGIYNFLLGMAGIVAFALLIWGGVQMLLYSVDEEMLKKGKSTVIQALIGLAVILLAYVVVNTLLSVLGVDGGAGGFFSGARLLGTGGQ